MTRRKALLLIVLLFSTTMAFPLIKWIIFVIRRPDLGKLRELEPLIDELVDTIIPATDSPGAREAGVGGFVVGKVLFFMDRREQNFFVDGLKEVDRMSLKHHGNDFTKCTMEQRLDILNNLENRELILHPLLMKVKYKFLGFPFISYLKAYTIEGYCTSELGATRCLNYQAVPINYQACIRMEPGQRSWATK